LQNTNSFSNGLSGLNANQNLSSISDNNGLVSAFKQALQGMAFEIDGDKIGQLIISKVERVVFS
jgi:hypothetical protein